MITWPCAHDPPVRQLQPVHLRGHRRNLLLRTTPEGGSVRLGDVAKVELGAENYAFISKFNGYPATGFAVSLATGANALDTAERVKKTVGEMSHNFPDDMTYAFPVDTTPFIETSIHEV